jgi:hypothetical protein
LVLRLVMVSLLGVWIAASSLIPLVIKHNVRSHNVTTD